MVKLSSRFRIDFNFWALALCLLLVRLPVALGFRQQPEIRFLFLLPIVAVTIKNIVLMLFKTRFHFSKSLFLFFLMYCFLLAVAFVRTLLSGKFPASTVLGNLFIWALVAIFGFSMFVVSKDEQTRFKYRRAIFVAIYIYIIFNVVLYLAGFQSPEVLYTNPFKAAMLNSLGIHANRVLFPTAGGINTIGSTAGVGLVAGVVMLISRESEKPDKILATLGGLSGLAMILLTDSRGALAYSLAVILAVIFLPKIFYRLLRWLPILAPILPLLLLSALSFLPNTVITALSRSGSDLANLSNRLEIWRQVLNELSNFKLIHLVGFGYRGQVLSGISSSYSYLFTSYVKSEVASAHNFLLQSILETGYLGTIVLLFLLFIVIVKLTQKFIQQQKDYTLNAMLFVIVFLVLSGINEAIFSADFQEVFIIFLLIVAAVGTIGTQSASDKNIPRTAAGSPILA